MFDKHINILKRDSTTNVTEINNPSVGSLVKTHKNSQFIRFKKGSQEEKTLFSIEEPPYLIYKKQHNNFEPDQKPKDYRQWETEEKVQFTVLQIVVFGQDEFLCEIIKTNFEDRNNS